MHPVLSLLSALMEPDWDLVKDETLKYDEDIEKAEEPEPEKRRLEDKDDLPPLTIPLEPKEQPMPQDVSNDQEKDGDDEEYNKHIKIEIIPLQDTL
ncbi:hypothetical protein CROQUDRAFT_97164 [Cronartium quercuum f. sp. fusiforme G11]|uniref:Uncharacterized protein n=1 Tax=Cronartium quercuum f. sp. fusiforme G11 TaxID=708437 RepID=A0A9P6T878_9BASI|nr:hypothetical protein CROQUDRAFT_97164 [Cronartium quercuum f. sp. fusiforme G11]